MTKLIRKGVKFEWTDECQIGFDYLKACLTEAPILKNPEPSKRYVVFTDASDQAAAAILTQEYTEDGETKEMPIAYLLHGSLIPSSNGVLWSRNGMLSTMPSRSGDTTLKMQRYS